MAHFNIVVPVQVGEQTRYRRVGALFENRAKDSGEVYYKIVLDFPVGATEMLAFEPRSHEDETASGDGAAATCGQAAASGTASA